MSSPKRLVNRDARVGIEAKGPIVIGIKCGCKPDKKSAFSPSMLSRSRQSGTLLTRHSRVLLRDAIPAFVALLLPSKKTAFLF